jgi:hypothetical protein
MKHAQLADLHRFTRRQYARMIDHGVLDEDDPIELLDGLLLVKKPLDLEVEELLRVDRPSPTDFRAACTARGARPSSG